MHNQPKLSQPQIDFLNYLVYDNLTQQEAYLKAYPQSSPQAAASSSTDLLKLPKISEALELKRAEKEEIIKAPLKAQHQQAIWTREKIDRLRAELFDDPDTSDTVKRALLADAEASLPDTAGEQGEIRITWGQPRDKQAIDTSEQGNAIDLEP